MGPLPPTQSPGSHATPCPGPSAPTPVTPHQRLFSCSPQSCPAWPWALLRSTYALICWLELEPTLSLLTCLVVHGSDCSPHLCRDFPVWFCSCPVIYIASCSEGLLEPVTLSGSVLFPLLRCPGQWASHSTGSNQLSLLPNSRLWNGTMAVVLLLLCPWMSMDPVTDIWFCFPVVRYCGVAPNSGGTALPGGWHLAQLTVLEQPCSCCFSQYRQLSTQNIACLLSSPVWLQVYCERTSWRPY